METLYLICALATMPTCCTPFDTCADMRTTPRDCTPIAELKIKEISATELIKNYHEYNGCVVIKSDEYIDIKSNKHSQSLDVDFVIFHDPVREE